MLLQAFILSFQITTIYILFQDGMLLRWFRRIVECWLDNACVFFSKKLAAKDPALSGKMASKYIQKPVWGCVICMAGIWTIILTWSFNFPLIFIVCGINVLIDKFINDERGT